jgi:hypothetical protein
MKIEVIKNEVYINDASVGEVCESAIQVLKHAAVHYHASMYIDGCLIDLPYHKDSDDIEKWTE